MNACNSQPYEIQMILHSYASTCIKYNTCMWATRSQYVKAHFLKIQEYVWQILDHYIDQESNDILHQTAIISDNC